jgi:hypothetical protein
MNRSDSGSIGTVPETGLGDLARALDKLRPQDPETRRAIARFLGFELIESGASSDRKAEDENSTEEKDFRRGSVSTSGPIRQSKSSAREPLSDRPGRRLTPLHIPEGKIESIDGLFRGPVLPLPPNPEEIPWDLPLPLLNPLTVRSAIFFALSTSTKEGDVDVEALARILSFSEQWPGRLPRLPRSTVRLGAHVVFDRRTSMAPFYQDQDSVFEVVLRVIGPDRTSYSSFRHSPSEILQSGQAAAYGDRLPNTSTPTLLLTDLGIGSDFKPDGPPSSAWMELIERLHRVGSPVVALVPYPSSRWPNSLARKIPIFCWDRGTTAGSIRRRLGTGHRIAGAH